MVVQLLSAGASVVAGLYGFDNVADFVANHVETLKAADSLLANRCGKVLEAAQVGFGVGSESSLMLIGVGRTLLGGVADPVATGAATLSNPVTMTCAAIGAIHYGWQALGEEERTAILSSVSRLFNTGIELVRSITSFALQTIRTLMSSEQLAELKKLVAEGAAAFGRRLGEITHALSDRSRDCYNDVTDRLVSAKARVPTISLDWLHRNR